MFRKGFPPDKCNEFFLAEETKDIIARMRTFWDPLLLKPFLARLIGKITFSPFGAYIKYKKLIILI